MKRSMLVAADEAGIRNRMTALGSERPRHWGKMTAPQALCHLLDSIRVATGELEAKQVRIPLLENRAVRWLFVHTLPWPKGKLPTAPEFLATKPAGAAADVAAWNAALDRFLAVARDPNGKWAPHPAFGPLDSDEWGRLVWRHHDHHLRQFGA